MTQPEAEELKPCPCCGGKAVAVEPNGSAYAMRHIECTQCGLRTKPVAIHFGFSNGNNPDEQRARHHAIWNTRAASQLETVGDWMPMETAPKDGTRVLGYRFHEGHHKDEEEFFHVVWWQKDCFDYEGFMDSEQRRWNIGAWMPLKHADKNPTPTQAVKGADDCNHAWPNMAGIEGKCFNCGKTWHEAIIEPAMKELGERLSKKLKGEEISHGKTIDQRDRAEDMADQLAHLIERITGVEIGEHSSTNCPWENAVENGEDYLSERTPAPLETPVENEALKVLDDIFFENHGNQPYWDDEIRKQYQTLHRALSKPLDLSGLKKPVPPATFGNAVEYTDAITWNRAIEAAQNHINATRTEGE